MLRLCHAIAIFFLAINLLLAGLFVSKSAFARASFIKDNVSKNYKKIYLTVKLNHQSAKKRQLFLRDSQGRLWVTTIELKLWKLSLPAANAIVFEHQHYYPLFKVSGVSYTLNVSHKTIIIKTKSKAVIAKNSKPSVKIKTVMQKIAVQLPVKNPLANKAGLITTPAAAILPQITAISKAPANSDVIIPKIAELILEKYGIPITERLNQNDMADTSFIIAKKLTANPVNAPQPLLPIHSTHSINVSDLTSGPIDKLSPTSSSNMPPTNSVVNNQEIPLTVTINEQASTEIKFLFIDAKGRLCATAADFKQWRLHVPKVLPVHNQDHAYYPLNSFPGLTYKIDVPAMSVSIQAPPKAFDHTSINLSGNNYKKPNNPPRGGFINYNLYTNKTVGSPAQSNGLFEMGASGFNGVMTNSLIAQEALPGNSTPPLSRLLTTYTQDDPEKMGTIRIGDAVSRSGSWGGSTNFGGVQWASNFSTQPGFITFPLPALRGEAVIPSTVDLYVNNTLISRTNVQPGFFGINSIPVITGQGEVRMVTRDIQGREQVIMLPFYNSNVLLREGLHDYSYELGFIRKNLGINSNDYGRFLAVGTNRWGINDKLTAEWHGELLKDQETIGAGESILFTKIGVVSTYAAASQQQGRFGGLLSASMNSQRTNYSLGINLQTTSPDYTQIGIQPGKLAPKFQGQVYIGAPIGSSSIGMSYMRQHNRSTDNVSQLTVSYGRNLGKYWNASLSAQTNLGGANGKAVYVTLIRPLGNNTSVNMSYSRSNGTDTPNAQIIRSLPVGTGYGYNLYASGMKAENAGAKLSYQNSVGTYIAEGQRQQDQKNYNFTAKGGIVYFDKDVFFSREITNSYGAVSVPGFANVGVYADNQLLVRTNSKGNALLPNLRPYQENKISIDPLSLPLNAQFEKTELTAVPYYRSGVSFQFPAKTSIGATLHIKLDSGEPVPEGAMVTLVGQKDEFPVAADGYVYISGLTAHNKILVEWDKQSCEFELDYAARQDPIPDLGAFKCKIITSGDPQDVKP